MKKMLSLVCFIALLAGCSPEVPEVSETKPGDAANYINSLQYLKAKKRPVFWSNHGFSYKQQVSRGGECSDCASFLRCSWIVGA